MSSVDDKSYYRRKDYSVKIKTVTQAIDRLSEVRTVLDVGCNTGEVSRPLVKKGIKVTGIYLSNNLLIPERSSESDLYRFINADIASYRGDVRSDCIIFLSLYHHLLNDYGIEKADDVFYKLFFNSKYLIFDTGNVTEKSRATLPWYKAQKKYFQNEEELLKHFGVQYTVLGQYDIAGGRRSIVLFEHKEEISYKTREDFKRLKSSKNAHIGLISPQSQDSSLFLKTNYSKVALGPKYFFCKKHTEEEWNIRELENTIRVYSNLDPKNLIPFYGYNKNLGLIFKWIDDLKYISGKHSLSVKKLNLQDVDIVEVDGNRKLIDFHW